MTMISRAMRSSQGLELLDLFVYGEFELGSILRSICGWAARW